ncbi:hypothetical protein, partial [Shewanella algae]|uniref:hypothetical protein n=1 Tax=Shewanella algae TaxID=38313 RepID=UPI00313B0212
QTNNDDIKDLNANEFGTQPLGPILLGYRDNLSNDFKTWIKPHVQASFYALRHHKVPVKYTNIFLMKAVSLILLGASV